MKILNSIALRLTVQYFLYLYLSVAILVGVFYYQNIYAPLESLKADIRTEADELARIHRLNGPAGLAKALEARRHVDAERLAFDALIDPAGTVLTANLPGWPAKTASDWLSLEADLYVDGQEEDREALVLDRTLADGTRILLGRNIEEVDDLEEELQGAVAVFVPVTAALAIIGGLLLGRSVGRRIEALDSAARRIAASTLSERIPLTGKNDDLDHLTVTLNSMLTRLERAFEELHRTSDSLAHELRTPLARLRSHLEELLQQEPPSDSLVQAINEVDVLGSLFDAVLAVTRLEMGAATLPLGNVDMSAILSDAAELYAGVAEDRGVQFDIDVAPGLTLHGHADALFQATCNLLDNAMKYASPGGAVTLNARTIDDEIAVTVSDTGPGIPDDLHELVFRRFYRAPSATGEAGLGMGLAFVAAVNAIHGARTKLKSGPQGLEVQWRIPRKVARPADDKSGTPAFR